MREHPDHHDAELMLRLYDLRRDAKLREARAWIIREFQADSPDEFFRKYPPGTKENDYFRMAISYWEMAGSIVNHGLIKEEFFFESNAEFWAVWQKTKTLAPGMRERFKNPDLWRNLEGLAQNYEKWQETRAPGAIEAFRERLRMAAAKK